MLKVIDRGDLRSRVALECLPGIIQIHSNAIIKDSNQGFAAINKLDINSFRTGIKSVLDQFLYDRSGPLNDFSSRYLVDRMKIQEAYGRHR